MVKHAIISTILFVLLASAAAEAFIAQRTSWWGIRIDELTDKKAELLKGGSPSVDRNVINLIDREISRGRETLDLMKKNTSSEPRRVSDTEIRSMIQQALQPLYALRCFESIMDGSDSESAASASRAFFDRKSGERSRALSVAAPADGDKDVPPVRLGHEEAKALTLELVIGGVINQYDARYGEIVAAIEKEILAGTPKNGALFDVFQIKERIRESAMKRCADFEFITDSSMAGALDQSWTWRGAAASIDREAGRIADVRKLLAGAGISLSAERAVYFTRNPLSLDQLYFDRVAERYQADFDRIHPSGKKDRQADAFRLPDFSQVAKAVDAHRRKILPGITGREDDDYFTSASAALRGAGARITRSIEKKIEACEQGECENASELTRARRDLEKERELAERYAAESISFVKWASKSRAVSGETVISEYRYRAERSASYLQFVRSLAEKSAGIAPLKSPDHHMKYTVYVKNIPRLLSALHGKNAVDREVLPSLTAGENAALRRLRTDFNASVNETQRAITAAHSAYYARHNELNRIKFEKEGRRDAGIAQFDLDQMAGTLNDYVTLYGTMGYSEKALKRYQELFRKLESAESADARKQREDAVRAGTMIPLLADFDTTAMAREHATRTYLKKEIRSMVSRIHSLANLYRQYDISTGHILSHAESSRILDALERSPRAAVADWVMDEINAGEIDRKAVQKLTQAGMMRDWRPSVSPSGGSGSGILVEITQLSLKLTVPEGWLEDRTDSYQNDRGIFKVFRSRDNTSSIEIARIAPPHESPLNELSLTWHRKIGSRVVKGKWGRQNDTDYYWTIARDGERHVRETWAFGEGSNTVIISGSSPRDRFGFFHKKMEGVINSITK